MTNIFSIKGLQVQEYAISANAILGIRDSGKTYTATKAAEELFAAGIPFIALDPIGVWHSLRIPGLGSGIGVVVAGGKYGDLPLTVASAPKLVRAAMAANISLVLDLFSTELSKADWRKIVREVVTILLHENSERGLRHVFIEEAAEFVPQRVKDGLVFDAVERLVRMGGNSKLGCTLINQRSADLNKSVLELCATVFVHRQTGKNTIADLRKWLEMMEMSAHDRSMFADTLPSLNSGECWVFSTQLKGPKKIIVPKKNSAHPDRRAPPSDFVLEHRASIPREQFIKEFEKLSPQKKEANPALFKPGPLKLVTSPKISDADLERARKEGYSDGAAIGWQHGWTAGYEAGAKDQRTSMFQVPVVRPAQPPAVPAMVTRRKTQSTGSPKPEPRVNQLPEKPRLAINVDAPALSGAQAEVLKGLAWWQAMGHGTVTRAQLAGKIGWKVKGSHLRNRLAELSKMALIEYPGDGIVQLTRRGAAAAPIPDTDQTLHASIRASLSGAQREVFDALWSFDGPISRAGLAEALNWEPNGSHLRNRLAELSALEIVEYPVKGDVVLQGWVRG